MGTLSWFDDVTYFAAFFAGLPVAAVCVGLACGFGRRRDGVLSALLSALVVGGVVAYWWAWGFAFDAADGGFTASRAVVVTTDVCLVLVPILLVVCVGHTVLVLLRRRGAAALAP